MAGDLGPARAMAVLICALGPLAVAACAAPPPVLDAGIRTDEVRALETGDGLFIAQFEEEADLSGVEDIEDWGQRGTEVVRRLQDTATRSQADAIAAAEAADARYDSLWISNSLVFAGTGGLAQELAQLPGVERVWTETVPGGITAPQRSSRVRERPPEGNWALDALGVPKVRSQGLTGTGVTVGIVDTGVDWRHPQIVETYRGSQRSHDRAWWSPLRSSRDEPQDLSGHGTSVASLIVGRDTGVAPGATWVAALGCSRDNCTLAGVTHALQFMLAPTTVDDQRPRPAARPHIVNSSWVRGDNAEPMERASRALTAAGIFQVYAAGNTGPACATVIEPGESDAVVSVGAVGPDRSVATFSARGPTISGHLAPDVVAPGEAVPAAQPGGYALVSGSSFSAPLVSGVAALVLQANPQMVGRPSEVTNILRSSAAPVPDASCGVAADAVDGTPNNAGGFGLVSAQAAVRAARGLDVTTLD